MNAAPHWARRTGCVLAVALGLLVVGYLIYYWVTYSEVAGGDDTLQIKRSAMVVLLGPLALAWTLGGAFSWRGIRGWRWAAIVASAFVVVLGIGVVARSPDAFVPAWAWLLPSNLAVVMLLLTPGRQGSRAARSAVSL